MAHLLANRLAADPKVSLQTNTLRASLNGFDSTTASATWSNCIRSGPNDHIPVWATFTITFTMYNTGLAKK